MKKSLLIAIPLIFILSCKSMQTKEPDSIFEYSVLKALDNGVLEGYLTVGELKKHGDLGLGTYNKMDGEMVVLDHNVYRISSEGITVQPDDKTFIPYSIVTFYNEEKSFHIDGPIDYMALKEYTENVIPSRNLFYAFRIKGDFEYIKCGGTRIQEKPYDKTLNQILADRPVYEGKNIRGTLVGFWCPSYIGDICTHGFHLHFLSEDKHMGGHLMEFSAKSLDAGYDIKHEYQIMLPETQDFHNAAFRSESVNY